MSTYLKDNFANFKHRPYFPMFLCLSDEWRQNFLKFIMSSIEGEHSSLQNKLQGYKATGI